MMPVMNAYSHPAISDSAACEQATKELWRLLQKRGAPSIRKVEKLVEQGADLHATQDNGQTMLGMAVKNNHIHVVYYLLERHSIPYEISQEEFGIMLSETARGLHRPFADALTEKRISLLLDLGANPNYFGPSNKKSPLHMASKQGWTDVSRALVDAGALLNSKIRANLEYVHHHAEGLQNKDRDWSLFYQERWRQANALADQPDAEKATPELICALANVRRVYDVMQPEIWRGHETKLQALMATLPPWLATEILHNMPGFAPLLQVDTGTPSHAIWNGEVEGVLGPSCERFSANEAVIVGRR